MTTQEQLTAVKAAKPALAAAGTEQKNQALLAMADALLADAAPILAANQEDLDAARGTISEVMLDRLALNQARLGWHVRHILLEQGGRLTCSRTRKIRRVALPRHPS